MSKAKRADTSKTVKDNSTKNSKKYYDQTTDEVIAALNSSLQGLTSHQVEERISQYGLNELKQIKKVSKLKILLNQFTSPIVWILLFAIGVSLFLTEYVDASVIAAIVILNTFLGFIQEYKAERAIEALRKLTSPQARVVRNGREMMIESKLVVPGEIIILREGDTVPADARIIESNLMRVEQASLTGESAAIIKHTNPLPTATLLADRSNMIYCATSVVSGNGKAVVTGTGMTSEVGKIATLIQETTDTATSLQKKLQQLGKYLTFGV